VTGVVAIGQDGSIQGSSGSSYAGPSPWPFVGLFVLGLACGLIFAATGGDTEDDWIDDDEDYDDEESVDDDGPEDEEDDEEEVEREEEEEEHAETAPEAVPAALAGHRRRR
jgi:hypothetical protein